MFSIQLCINKYNFCREFEVTEEYRQSVDMSGTTKKSCRHQKCTTLGQGNLGVLYSVQCKKFDIHNYVRRIGKYLLLNFSIKILYDNS
jgi:hypothetical protein